MKPIGKTYKTKRGSIAFVYNAKSHSLDPECSIYRIANMKGNNGVIYAGYYGNYEHPEKALTSAHKNLARRARKNGWTAIEEKASKQAI
jgi:hypothetical protein